MALLWQALSFPELPLDVFRRGGGDDLLLAVVDARKLLTVSRSAMACGIRPGMRPAQARSLCPDLQLHDRRSDLEQDSLRRLADGLLQFSGWVSRQPPNELLVEIGGSLRLFGGLGDFRRQLERHMAALGLQWRDAVATTPGAACLLGRIGDSRPVIDEQRLAERLSPLPIDVLELTTAQRQALEGLGLRTLGDCLRLPRGDLGRRLGNDLVTQLERALGERPDPRPAHRPRPVFRGEQPLPAPAHDSSAVLFGLQRLLRELEGLLCSLQSGVQRVRLQLQHTSRPATVLVLGLQGPGRDAQRLLAVARERLERTPLQAPVIGLVLEARQLVPLAAQPEDLLDQGRVGQLPWQQLAERLRARLGPDAVSGLKTAPDHRPERAWQPGAPETRATRLASPRRPLWLLPEPVPLRCRGGNPEHRGVLTLCHGPERIESGWWDGQDVRRDYYEALDGHGARLWIFRDHRQPDRWFLHGYFA